MGKGRPYHTPESLITDRIDVTPCLDGEMHHCGADGRPRAEAIRRHTEGQFDLRRLLREDREHTIVFTIRFGSQSQGHLGLQHEHQTIEAGTGIEQRKENRGRDIIGKIRHHHRTRRQGLEGKREGVPDPKVQVGTVAERLLQMRLQLRIDLHGDDASRSGAQVRGQCAAPRPDLQHGVLRVECRQGHDLADNVRIDEEVLTEPFQGWGK